MTAHRGYFSLIQFCPDASRLEAANVGVVLLCPELGFLEARTSRGNARVRRFFGPDAFHPVGLNMAKQSFVRRLKVEWEGVPTVEQFQHFVDTRANELQLTAPRPVKVFDPACELQRLFDQLVTDRPKAAMRTSVLRSKD